MKPFASRSKSAAPALAPNWIRVHRMLVFALLLSLTSGLRLMPESMHATFTRALNSILLHGPVIDWQVGAFDLTSAALTLPLRIAFSGSAPFVDGNPEEAVWSLARPVEIHTGPESNLAGGEVTVRVRVHPIRISLEN